MTSPTEEQHSAPLPQEFSRFSKILNNFPLPETSKHHHRQADRNIPYVVFWLPFKIVIRLNKNKQSSLAELFPIKLCQ
jgi:hypothetical protein